MADAIATLNAGSSSVKFSLYETDGAKRKSSRLLARGEVEGLGCAPHFFVRDAEGRLLDERRWSDPDQAFQSLLEAVIDWAEAHLSDDRLVAVGHRVVHGGPDHRHPERVTAKLLDELDRLTPLAPLHERHNVLPIRSIAKARPGLPQVVCFDTAFHQTMPKVATRFGLPREYEQAGVRRYGFHGLSYEYIAGRLTTVAPRLAEGRTIAAHLGNGASLCAMLGGRSVDTTMGLTSLDGLLMGTRCGALDPGVILYLEQQRGMTAKQVETLLYAQSGLLGVSGTSSDMRVLLSSADPRASEAVDLFAFRIAREIGALTSSLCGLDGLVFTAGIGEHAFQIREKVCARLGWLGVSLDEAANRRNEQTISAQDSRVAVLVIPTDEEAMIVRHTMDALSEPPAG